MKIRITLLGLLFSLMSYSQEIPTKYNVASDPGNKKNAAVNQNKVYSEVEQAAEFPGGITEFRNMLAKNFDSLKFKDQGNQSTIVSFIIEKDGTMTDFKAQGNNSEFNSTAIQAVRSVKEEWIPGKVNGEFVRARFRLPIKMNFD